MLKPVLARGNNKVFTTFKLHLRYLMREKTWTEKQEEENEKFFDELMMKV